MNGFPFGTSDCRLRPMQGWINTVTLLYGALREVVVSDMLACLRTGDVESFRSRRRRAKGKSMAVKVVVHIVNRSQGVVIADHVEVATSFWERGRGLIGRRRVPAGFGFVIKPCRAIHTFLMAIPIDVVHVDRDGRIVRILHEIPPWRLGPIVLNTTWVIELPAGTAKAKDIQTGDVVELVEEKAPNPEAPAAAMDLG